MNCRAPLLGKQLLQTPNPRTRFATPLEPSLTPRLLPHPLLLSPSGPESSPSPSSLHIYAGGANADLGTVPLCFKFPLTRQTGIWTCRFCRLSSHACTHARRGTGEDKRAKDRHLGRRSALAMGCRRRWGMTRSFPFCCTLFYVLTSILQRTN